MPAARPTSWRRSSAKRLTTPEFHSGENHDHFPQPTSAARLSPIRTPIPPSWNKRDSRTGWRNSNGAASISSRFARPSICEFRTAWDTSAIGSKAPACGESRSDSGEDYFDSVFQEEKGILTDMLAQLGVTIEEVQ